MLELVDSAIGSWHSGALRMGIFVPAAAAVGDLAVVLLAADNVDNAFGTVPDGWESLLTPTDTGSYKVWVYGKVLEEADLGDLAAWYGSGVVSPVPAGAMAVFRGAAIGAPLVPDDGAYVVQSISNNTVSWHSAWQTQADDVRLLLFWCNGGGATIDVDASGYLDDLEHAATTDGDVVLAVTNTPTYGYLGDDRDLTAVCDCVVFAVTIRGKPMPVAVGLSDAVPGHIGLVPHDG